VTNHPQPGFALRGIFSVTVALSPAGFIRVCFFLGLGKLGGFFHRGGQRFGDFLSQIVDRSQRHFDLKEVFQCLLRLPFTLAVFPAQQSDHRCQARSVTVRCHTRRQVGAGYFATVGTSQLVQPMFIHQRLEFRQLNHLMSYRVGIIAGQSRPASATRSRTVITDTAALFRWIELSLMPLVTRLGPAFLAARLAFFPRGAHSVHRSMGVANCCAKTAGSVPEVVRSRFATD
jgi:hypothetical protein